MDAVVVKFKKLNDSAIIPSYAHPGDAGMDIYSIEDLTIAPGAYAMVHTGVSMALPVGYEAQVRPRSGLAFKHGVTVLNSPGTIDAGYRGELCVLLINHGPQPFVITPGMRIAQLVIASLPPVEVLLTDSLDDTSRGTGGFGSTGV